MSIGTIPFILFLLGTLIYFSLIPFSGWIHFFIGVCWALAISTWIMVNQVVKMDWIGDVFSRIRNRYKKKKLHEEDDW